MTLNARRVAAVLLLWTAGCGAEQGPHAEEIPGVQIRFDLGGDWKDATFFSFPYPSDLRQESGKPALDGFPNPYDSEIIGGVVKLAASRQGFPVLPVAHFEITGALAPRQQSQVIPARADSPVLLVDVDPASPKRGTLYPTVAHTLPSDAYLPRYVLAVAPWPGLVLAAGRTYAFVVLRSLNDKQGQPLGVPLALAQLKQGEQPEGAMASRAETLYGPLWTALKLAGVRLDQVAGATVFTTGDVVAEMDRMAQGVVKQHDAVVTKLALDAVDGDHPGFCELVGLVTLPQFQRGTPPFNSEGLFELDAAGVPKKQREEGARLVITLPKGEMPAKGYPLLLYLHGTAGTPAQLVDRPTVGQGPAQVVAPEGVAGAAFSLPLNPERLPGADKFAYLNLNNLTAFRDTFRQGALEVALVIEALGKLEIPASALGGCAGPSLPAGATGFRLNTDGIAVLGQSMGAAYANMIAPIATQVRALVPTGSGGYWPYFMFRSSKVPGPIIGPVAGVYGGFDFTHPVAQLLLTAWEAADAMPYVARVGRWPLSGHQPVDVFQPVGRNDSYFDEEVFDAMALAYGNQQAGTELWSTMQSALALDGLDGIVAYPVQGNVTSAAGVAHTGVVAQYARPNDNDGHHVAFVLDEVKYQYRCFVAGALLGGTAAVPAPAALSQPCP